MSRTQTTMVWIAVVLFFGAYIFPLWSISLSAPQYPEGMGMKIWISKVTGAKPHDLKNINGLNHYIGMKEIHADAIPELRFMKFIVAGLILLGVLAGLLRKRAMLTAWVVISVVVALVGLADFYKWGYDYGHNLDPDAPIKVPGMTYQPPLIGSKQLLNITATSYPDIGGMMLVFAVGLGVFALLLDWRRGRRGAALPPQSAPDGVRAAVVFAAAALALSSCSTEPSPIRFGSDTCDYCKMTIADENYGGEIITKKGRIYKFDSVECLFADAITKDVGEENIEMYLTVDYANPGELVDATTSTFLHSPTLRSPMAMNITSFAERSEAEAVETNHPGDLLTFDETRALVAARSDRQ